MKRLILIAILGIGLSQMAGAQAPGFSDDTEDNTTNNNAPGFEDDTNDVPVDGGVSLLLGAGVLYGFRKYRTKQKECPSQQN